MASLAREFKNTQLEVRAYNYISEVYKHDMDSVKALQNVNIALEISEESESIKDYLLSINQVGRVYHHFQYYEKAIQLYGKGIDAYNKNKDEKCLNTLGTIYSNLSNAYEKLEKHDESIQAILKSIELNGKTNSYTQKSYNLYVLGYRYMDLKNYPKAEEYFLKSLVLSDSISLKAYAYMSHHGLGINYSRWGDYEKALYHNNLALNYYRKKGDKLYEFDVLNNIAVVYERKEVTDSVIKYAEKALKVAEEINHQLAISGAKLTLSNAYIKLKKYSAAKKLLKEISKDTVEAKIISKKSKAAIYLNFSQVNEAQKNYSESLKFYKKFKALYDSIEEEKYNSKLLDTESKYRLEQKNNTILSQSLQIEKQIKQRRQLWYVISIILVVTLFLGYLLHKRKKQIQMKEGKYLQELERGKRLRKMVSQLQNASEENYGLNDTDFLNFIKEEVNINESLLTVYLGLIKGHKYKDIATTIGLKLSGTKTRINSLYEKLKIYANIDLDTRISKEDAVKIFNDLYVDFQFNR